MPLEGVEYRYGTLHGTEVREYLLTKWKRRCVYCGAIGVPLNMDHIHPRSEGGSDRVSNLTLACVPCNQAKGNRPIEDFLAHQPKLLAKILSRGKAPLRDAAAVNSTRWALWRSLESAFPAVNADSGGRTKWNRTRSGLPKTHNLDALCVGVLHNVTAYPNTVLTAVAGGRGRYRRTDPDRFGSRARSALVPSVYMATPPATMFARPSPQENTPGPTQAESWSAPLKSSTFARLAGESRESIIVTSAPSSAGTDTPTQPAAKTSVERREPTLPVEMPRKRETAPGTR